MELNNLIVDASATTCKKALHIIKNESDKTAKRYPFNPAAHVVFRSADHFSVAWETSSLLELFMPEGSKYIHLTVTSGVESVREANTRWFEEVARHGYKTKQSIFRVLFGDWDDDGSAIMVDARGVVKTLDDLGLHTVLQNEADGAKLRKYLRRILAHHEWALKGEVVDVAKTRAGKKAIVSVAGHQFDVMHVEFDSPALGNDDVALIVKSQKMVVTNRMLNTALADGIAIIDEELCHTLGELLGNETLKSMREGDAFKGTALDCFGLGKGFFHVMKNCKYGIVLFGTKTQVKFDHFFLGSLGEVKGGEAYTDLQSMINFDYWKNDVVYNLTTEFIRQVLEAMHDETKMRHLFLTHIAPVAELLGKEGEDGRELWVLIEAMRKGVPILKNPALMRRVRRHLLTHVLNTAKGRVPFLSNGARFNLQPDMDVFRNEDGLVDGTVDWNRSSIGKDEVVCMDLNEGRVAMWRQPSGHKLERVITTNRHSRRFRKYRGMNRMVLGVMAWLYLRIMGGGDMDDAVCAVDNLEWITLVENTKYPFTELPEAPKVEKVEDKNKDNPYRKVRNQYPRAWEMGDLFSALAKAGEMTIGIGVFVNAIMLDMLLSGEHKENMLTALCDLIADRGANALAVRREESDGPGNPVKIVEYTYGQIYDWLRARTDDQLREAASNLEAGIDFVKMGKGDPAQMEPMIKKILEVRNSSLVFPELFTIQRKKDEQGCRIPAAREFAGDYIVLPSMVCNELSRISNEINMLEQALTEEEWFNVDSIPASLDAAFPRDSALRSEAMQLRSDWAACFQNRAGKIEDVYKQAVETVVRPGIYGGLFELDETVTLDEVEGLRVHYAVEHARLTYRGRKDKALTNPDGSFRSYPDGLLWTNAIGGYYIKALELAGLTGEYVPVMFDRWSRKYSRGTFPVHVKSGVVFHAVDNHMLGTTKGGFIEEGSFTMTDGMICVQEPSVEMSEFRAVVDEEFTRPVEDGFGSMSDDDFMAMLAR